MIHPTALINSKQAQCYTRETETHINTKPTSHAHKPGQPPSLTPFFLHLPSLIFSLLHTHTAHNRSPWPLPHDLSSLLPWQESSYEIRMTTGMTQSVAVESLHRVKSKESVCVCAR